MKALPALVLAGLLSGCATVPPPDAMAGLVREQQMQGLCTSNRACHDTKPPVGEPLIAYQLGATTASKHWI